MFLDLQRVGTGNEGGELAMASIIGGAPRQYGEEGRMELDAGPRNGSAILVGNGDGELCGGRPILALRAGRVGSGECKHEKKKRPG
jgi:hypothetical protein